uniref:Uncharacterized protein n=1 Tax=Romanomermis culicivorax TaxID=13658 RepID=A0A915KDH1_ROMCU
MVRDYDDMGCQTVTTETYGAAVQYSAPQSHIFCQTVNPVTQDVSVITDFDQFFDESNEQLVSSRDVNLGNTSIFSKDNHDCGTMQNRMANRELLSMSPAMSLSLSSDREVLEEENSLLTWCDTHTQTINFVPMFEQQSIETQTYFGQSSFFSSRLECKHPKKISSALRRKDYYIF